MKNIILLLLLLSGFVSNAQKIDSLAIKIDDSFARYSETMEVQYLYTTGFNLPYSIQTVNRFMSDDELSIARSRRTKLYIHWVQKMIEVGLDIDFNPDAPENAAYRNSIITVGVDPHAEEWKRKNIENSKKANRYHTFNRVMDRFRCFYKGSFVRCQKGRKEVVQYIKEYCAKENRNPDLLLLIFKKELEKQTCDMF